METYSATTRTGVLGKDYDLSAYPQCTMTSFVTETKVAISNTIDGNLQCDYSNRGTWKRLSNSKVCFQKRKIFEF